MTALLLSGVFAAVLLVRLFFFMVILCGFNTNGSDLFYFGEWFILITVEAVYLTFVVCPLLWVIWEGGLKADTYRAFGFIPKEKEGIAP